MEEVEFQLVPTHTTTYQAALDPLTGGSEEVKRSKSAPSTTRIRRDKNLAPVHDDDDYPRVVGKENLAVFVLAKFKLYSP